MDNIWKTAAKLWELNARTSEEERDKLAKRVKKLEGVQTELDTMTQERANSEHNRWCNFDMAQKRGRELDALKTALRIERKDNADEIERLETRVKELEAWYAGTIAECSHCGEVLPVDDTTHWETCEKHPARERIKELEAKLNMAKTLKKDWIGIAFHLLNLLEEK